MASPEPQPSASIRFVVIEGSPFGTPKIASFPTETAMREHVLARVRALAAPQMQARIEQAIADRVVSEDGVSATSEVLAGTLAFVRALARAYAPKLTITEKTPAQDEHDER